MKKLKYKKIDAFASSSSSGNPAGAIYLKSFNDLNTDEMQQIAKEQKGFVSEVGFIWEESDGSFGLRYYSSEREVEFCGHATIAIMYDLIKNRADLLAKNEIIINTKSDTLIVENHISQNDSVFITAPSAKYKSYTSSRKDILRALRTNERYLDENFDIDIINAGLETLIVPMKDLDAILSIDPDLSELDEFCKKIGVDIIILFTNDRFDKKNSYRTRVFAATFGYLEDPATGSGNSALGYYLLKYALWSGSAISIEQNGYKKNYNTVKLMTKEGKVLFGGRAVVKIEGTYLFNK